VVVASIFSLGSIWRMAATSEREALAPPICFGHERSIRSGTPLKAWLAYPFGYQVRPRTTVRA